MSCRRRTFTASVGGKLTSSKTPLSGESIGPADANSAVSRIPVANLPITVNNT